MQLNEQRRREVSKHIAALIGQPTGKVTPLARPSAPRTQVWWQALLPNPLCFAVTEPGLSREVDRYANLT